MRAFVVKHDAKKRGPLVDRYVIYSSCPQSFTSKHSTAKAAVGNVVFVVEVRLVGGATMYFLGYKYVVRKCEEHPTPGKWHDQFKYKNEAAAAPHADGIYFDRPEQITDPRLHAWLTNQRFGMAELPATLVPLMEAPFSLPRAGIKRCA